MTSVTGNPQTPGSYYEAHNQSVQDEKTDDKKKLASRGNANRGGPPSPDVNIGKTESGSHSNAGTPKPLSGDAQTALPRASDKDIKSLKDMGLMKPEIPADHKLEEITKNSLFEGFKAALSDTEIERFKEKMGGDWEDKNIPAEKRVVWAENSLKKLKEFDSEGGKASVANNGKIEGLARQIPLLPEFFLNSKNYTVAGSEGRKLGDFASDRQPDVSS